MLQSGSLVLWGIDNATTHGTTHIQGGGEALSRIHPPTKARIFVSHLVVWRPGANIHTRTQTQTHTNTNTYTETQIETHAHRYSHTHAHVVGCRHRWSPLPCRPVLSGVIHTQTQTRTHTHTNTHTYTHRSGDDYRIRVSGCGLSPPFGVGRSHTEKLVYTHMRGLYHQRCGTSLPATTTESVRPCACHGSFVHHDHELHRVRVCYHCGVCMRS